MASERELLNNMSEHIEMKCVVCGEIMERSQVEWRCKTCEAIWGNSSTPAKCAHCSRQYGENQAVHRQLEEAMVLGLNATRRARLDWDFCSVCLEESLRPGGWTSPATYAGWIRQEISEQTFTPRVLIDRGIPKKFVDFALGRFKPYP